MMKNEISIYPTGNMVAWMDVSDANLNDPDVNKSIRDRLYRNLQPLTVRDLERKVGDTEQIALLWKYELPAGLSDKLLKSVRWLLIRSIYKNDWTE